MKASKLSLVLYFIFGFLLFGSYQDLCSQVKIITMDQAIEIAIDQNLEIKIQNLEIEKALGYQKNAALIPNPVLSYYREDLQFGNLNAGESIISTAVPLNFIWMRSSKISEAAERFNIENFLFADKKRHLTFEVQKAYLENHYAALRYQAWQGTVNIFKTALEAGQERLIEGDIAGYDQQRIELEYLRYKKSEAEAWIKFENSMEQLKFLLGTSGDKVTIETVDNFSTFAPGDRLDNLISIAQNNRPDLLAARASHRAQQALLNLSKRNSIPDINFSIGYKKQENDFNGAVMQINAGIPIFNRNQGNIQSSHAALNQQPFVTDYLEKRIVLETKQVYNRYDRYKTLLEQFNLNTFKLHEEVLQVAQYSYKEGQMSLVELLDAVRAYSEAYETKYDVLLNYYKSIFEIEKVTAKNITEF